MGRGDPLRYRELGGTGLTVSELGLGGLYLQSNEESMADSLAATVCALEHGVNYIDTAPGYGKSEEAVGEVLKTWRGPVVVSTKLGGRPEPFDPKSRDGLWASVETSLANLGREQIDVLMIHEPDRPGQYDWWDDRERLLGPVREVLDDLKQDGLIRFAGLGGTSAYELARECRVGEFDVVLTAFNYSLLWREAEYEIFAAAQEKHMGIVVGSPMQQGALSVVWDSAALDQATWLSRLRRRQLERLYAFVARIGITLPELCLRFVLSNAAVSSVLTGARSEREMLANLSAVDKGPLESDVLEELDEIAAMVPFRPFEEPAGLPFAKVYNGLGRMV